MSSPFRSDLTTITLFETELKAYEDAYPETSFAPETLTPIAALFKAPLELMTLSASGDVYSMMRRLAERTSAKHDGPYSQAFLTLLSASTVDWTASNLIMTIAYRMSKLIRGENIARPQESLTSIGRNPAIINFFTEYANGDLSLPGKGTSVLYPDEGSAWECSKENKPVCTQCLEAKNYAITLTGDPSQWIHLHGQELAECDTNTILLARLWIKPSAPLVTLSADVKFTPLAVLQATALKCLSKYTPGEATTLILNPFDTLRVSVVSEDQGKSWSVAELTIVDATQPVPQ